jgi:hypothetical protein
VFHEELQSYIFVGLPSRVLVFVVLPTQMDLFLQGLHSTGQPMSGHADSHQALFFQEVDPIFQGYYLWEIEWSQLFAPSPLEL